jgi:hypothetical protein
VMLDSAGAEHHQGRKHQQDLPHASLARMTDDDGAPARSFLGVAGSLEVRRLV